MEFSDSKIKNLIYFSQKKFFSYFSGNESLVKKKKENTEKVSYTAENFLYFLIRNLF